MDDCILCSSTWDDHHPLPEHTFIALQAAGLTLKSSNVQLGPREVKYPGHILTADGVWLGEDRIKAIVDLPTPTTIKQLISVLGLVNIFRRFIPNLAVILSPLIALTKKGAAKEAAKRRSPEHDQACAKVISKDFCILVDALEAGAGAFPAQQEGDNLVIIAYFSRRFNDSQRHYSVSLKECCAVVFATQLWRP